MVGRVAFDQILRFFLRGADRVVLERDGLCNLFLDRSPDVASFRVPAHVISNFKVLLHRHDLHDYLVFRIGGSSFSFVKLLFLHAPQTHAASRTKLDRQNPHCRVK